MATETSRATWPHRILTGMMAALLFMLAGCGGTSLSEKAAGVATQANSNASVAPQATSTGNEFTTAWRLQSLITQNGDMMSYQQVWETYFKAWSDAVTYYDRVETDIGMLWNADFARNANDASARLIRTGTQLWTVMKDPRNQGILPSQSRGVITALNNVMDSGSATARAMLVLYAVSSSVQEIPSAKAQVRVFLNKDAVSRGTLSSLVIPYCTNCLPGL